MESVLIEDPRAGFLILFILCLADLILRKRAGKQKASARSEFFEYEVSIARETGIVTSFALILLKISPAFLIALIWALGRASKAPAFISLYAGIVGFSISLYLIMNLRHIGSLMIDALIKRRSDDLSGKLAIKKRFSLGQSAIQIFPIFVILVFAALLRPSPLFIGLALAPAALAARYLLLTKS